jgi:hypothetical protein
MTVPSVERRARQLARFGLATLVAFAVLATAHQTSAGAQVVADPDYWKQTAERQATVNSFVYGQSPQTIPRSYEVVAEEASRLRDAQRTVPPSNPTAPSLWQRIRTVPQRVGLSPALRTLGTIGLVAGGLDVGWKIGDGIAAKFVGFNVPEPITHATISAQQLNWVRGGYALRQAASGTNPWNGLSFSYPALVMPYDGWVWQHQHGWAAWWDYYNDTDQSWCNTFASPPPPPSGVERIEAHFECTTHPYAPPKAVGKTIAYTTPEHALGAPGPIEDYTGQPYDRWTPAPNPPPQTTVEQSIENELDKPENSLLLQWLNYQLGSPGETDPLGIGEPNADIEFPNREEKWRIHRHDFDPEHADADEYWRDAADVIRKTNDGWPDFEKCVRQFDQAEIYWDPEREAIVIVKDGKIDTFFPPRSPVDPGDTGYARRYYDTECAR